MALVNYAKKEIQFKLVYYGPGLCGKTTNLQMIHGRVPTKAKGSLTSLATSQDRTLFFDFLPLHTQEAIEGFVTKFQMYTVPGQVKYNSTRRLVLRNCDGIVFCADSQWDKMEENVESWENLRANVKRIYALHGAADKFDNLMHSDGHDFHDPMREQAFAFIDRHLGRRG